MEYEGCGFSRLGEKLRAARKENQMTQSALADGLVTRNMLSRIENGCAFPSLPTLCELASRLGRPVGYFLDDHDDGSAERRQRLVSLAKSAHREGKDASCLHYVECLGTLSEEEERLAASARYALALEGLYEGTIKESLSLFAEALKKEEFLSDLARAQGREYRALLDGFFYTHESGKEEEVIRNVLRFATLPTDLSLFAGVLTVLRSGGLTSAEAMLSVCHFSDGFYPQLLQGVLQMERGDFGEAKRHLLKAVGERLPSVFRAYALTLLERCAAETKDFEGAYAYMTARKELISSLTEK